MQPYTSPIAFGRALRAIAAPFLLSRLGILVAGLLAAVVIGYDPPPNPSAAWRVAEDPLRNLLARWDTYWYLDIAEHGYRWTGNPLEQQNVVFFPLLPIVMKTIGGAIGGYPLIAGFVASLAAFACALAYLWRWTAERAGEPIATTAVALLCAYPFAVFYGAVYTESLFLLALTGAWYHADRRELLPAALFGLMAGLLRPNGFLLAAPLGWLLFVDRRAPHGDARASADDVSSLGRLAVLAAPLAGLLAFTIFLERRFGDGTAWIAGQAAWPTIAPWASLRGPASSSLGPDPSTVVVHAGNAAALVLAIVALRPTARRLGAAAAILLFVNVAPALARHGLQSLGRFTAGLFPIFVWLAGAIPAERRRVAIAACAAGQVVAAMLFFTWRPLV
jgi:hypothetical protein